MINITVMSTINFNKLSFFYDIGHSSIGWSVFESNESQIFPNIKATGVLMFDGDNCQAKQRGVYRHMRRNIAARRNRISRIREALAQMQVLSSDDLDNLKTEYPWLLAGKVLSTGKILSWGELWAVIRYYCHNRGYDGNVGWSKNIQIEDLEDVKKVENANALMQKYNTKTQAETMCAVLDVDLNSNKNPKLKTYFKGENLAFPRFAVVNEVERIIDKHIGLLPKCDENFKNLLLGNWQSASLALGLKLPRLTNNFTKDRGLLFGQYIPKFDNRIISKCPISDKKVPSKNSREYFDFRWKSLLSNMILPETIDVVSFRSSLDDFLQIYSKITKTTLKKHILDEFGVLPSNFESMFLTEDMSDFVLDPVKYEILKSLYPNISKNIPDKSLVVELWSLIPNFVMNQLFRGNTTKKYTLNKIAQLLDKDDSDKLIYCISKIYNLSKPSKESEPLDNILNKEIRVKKQNGRAPYSREVMVEASKEIMIGQDPRSEGGAIYLKEENLEPNIDRWTNNHLVRHRLKMFKRLYLEMIDKYANGNLSNVANVSIEVIKDLQSFSGLDSKEKSSILNDLVKHHKSVSEYLKKVCPDLDTNGSILRKARIADDLQWKCPYTGRPFSPQELFFDGTMELEHIIPRSLRPSDSLESLVVTWKAVNDMKGQRTAMEFIREFEGQEVAGKRTHCIQTLKNYEDFVKNIKRPMHNYSDSDINRIKRRNILLKMAHYNKKESDFLPRDLTQTSHLNKLAFKVLKLIYKQADAQLPAFAHIPGSVTAAIRKNWDLLPLIGEVCPDIFYENNGDKILKDKNSIRSITHLHHAVDAISIGLSSLIFPKTKRFYELITKRKHNKAEKEELAKTGLINFSENGWRLVDLTEDFLDEIKSALNKAKVVKHIPKKMSGLRVEETLWRVLDENSDGSVNIRQYTTGDKGGSRRKIKYTKENKQKLLGYNPKNMLKSKLARNKCVFVIKENFGAALTNPPEVILYHNVWQRLQELKEKNGGRTPDILRRGNIIEVSEGKYKGVWSVASVTNNTKSGCLVNIINPIYVKIKSGTIYSKENVSVNTLLKNGFTILNKGLLGE